MTSVRVIVLLVAATCAHAQIKIDQTTSFEFATAEQGQEILTSRDEYVQRMSPFDRAARLKTDQEVSEKEYLKFVGKNVLAWNEAEKTKVTAAVQGIRKELESLNLPLPETVLLIKTTGKEEGGAAYTRANAIVLPRSLIQAPSKMLQRIIAHELFHVLSRANPELRDKLYAVIGFEKCAELAFPPELKPRKITNPDAPRNDYCIRIEVDGEEHWAVPILFSRSVNYDPQRGGEFFNYLQFKLLLVERRPDSAEVKPKYDGREPRLVSTDDVSGFFEQVGRNTGYIIHPEEILADNFALLVQGEGDLPSPEVVKKMKTILKEAKQPATSAPSPVN